MQKSYYFSFFLPKIVMMLNYIESKLMCHDNVDVNNL
jgi:hypothetical protein